MSRDFERPVMPGPDRRRAAEEEDRELRIRSYRSERAKRRRRRQRANAALATALVIATMVLIAVAIARFGPRGADGGVSPQPAPTVSIVSATDASDAFADSFDPDAEPTPVFASYRSLRLDLPVPASALTVIAFHQASNDKALSMQSLLADADMAKAAKLKRAAKYVYTTDTSGTGLPDGVPSILKGEVLRLWRSHRRGPTDRCADVGAKAGTAVYSPVTGTVLLVRKYDLYQKYPDYELHIKPDGWPEVDCVLIHIDRMRVKPGDRVIAGITQVAEVRLLSDRVTHQLGDYVNGGGDHTHVQLNKLDVPGRIEIEGKIYNVEKPEETITVTPAPPKK